LQGAESGSNLIPLPFLIWEFETMGVLAFISEDFGLKLLIAGLTSILALVGIVVSKSRYRRYFGEILIPVFLMASSFLLYATTFSFPKEKAGPAVIPHLWIFWIWILCGALLWRVFKGVEKPDPKPGRIGFLLLVIVILFGYYAVFQILGYFLSSFLLIVLLMHLLSYKKKWVIYSLAAGWVIFSYSVFYRLLHIQLPLGYFEVLF
jgi:hypothetical protein